MNVQRPAADAPRASAYAPEPTLEQVAEEHLLPHPLPPLRREVAFTKEECGGAPAGCCAKGVEELKETGGLRPPRLLQNLTPPPLRLPPIETLTRRGGGRGGGGRGAPLFFRAP